MELKMFTSRVVVSRPLKHLIFSFFSIKCQHVSEFISTFHFDVCPDAKSVLGMSWWHTNRILLTHLPFRSCRYFTKCLWVRCRENAYDKGIRTLIRIVFLSPLFRHCRKLTLTTDWHSYHGSHKNHVEILFMSSLHLWSKTLFLRQQALQVLMSWHVPCPALISMQLRLWQFHNDWFVYWALNIPDLRSKGHFATICSFSPTPASEIHPAPRQLK